VVGRVAVEVCAHLRPRRTDEVVDAHMARGAAAAVVQIGTDSDARAGIVDVDA